VILGDTLYSDKQQRIKNHYRNNKLVQPLSDITYPLPRPGYFGRPVQELVFFVHSLNILENINLMAQKYLLRFEVAEAKGEAKTYDIPIISKNHFYNQGFRVPLEESMDNLRDREERRTVAVLVIRRTNDKREIIELVGEFNFSNFHKDTAYKIVVTLQSSNKHNKGETVLHLSLALRSSLSNQRLEEDSFKSLEALSEEFLDYDMGSSNEVLGHMRELFESLEKIKSPLDEFSAEQNRRLKNSTLNYHTAPWLENSKATVEELKTIFYHLFPQ
jgi:hypothetical protein